MGGGAVTAIMARLLCWGRHCDWAHTTGYGAKCQIEAP